MSLKSNNQFKPYPTVSNPHGINILYFRMVLKCAYISDIAFVRAIKHCFLSEYYGKHANVNITVNTDVRLVSAT